MWTKTDHPVQVRLHVLTLILVSGLWHIHEAFQSFLGYKLPKDRQRVCVVPWTVPGPWKVFFAKAFAKDCIHMYGSHWDTHLLLKNCKLLSRKNFSMNQPWKGHIYQRHEKVYGCIVVIFIPKGVNENLNICKKTQSKKIPPQNLSRLLPGKVFPGHHGKCRGTCQRADPSSLWPHLP